MGATNKVRQAAFKERMREAGKRQITVWVDADQEKQVKDMLAGEALPVTVDSSAVVALTDERDTLAQRNADLEAELAGFRRDKSARWKLEREIDDLKFEVDSWQYKKGQRIEELLGGRYLMPKRDLVPVFLVDYADKPIERGYQFESAVKEALEFGRKAAVAASSIEEVAGRLERKGQLLAGEKAILSAATKILGNVHTKATVIKENAKRTAEQIKREEEARENAARAAIAAAFPDLQDVAILLTLSYQLSPRDDYRRNKLRENQPATAHVNNIQWDVECLADELRSELRHRVIEAIKAGASAADAATALRADFNASRPELENKYQGEITHIRACQVAAELRRANGQQ